jgi:hypothetical protein
MRLVINEHSGLSVPYELRQNPSPGSNDGLATSQGFPHSAAGPVATRVQENLIIKQIQYVLVIVASITGKYDVVLQPFLYYRLSCEGINVGTPSDYQKLETGNLFHDLLYRIQQQGEILVFLNSSNNSGHRLISHDAKFPT